MEIGNEISQKIRSAIKAKLIEQGAYVDDELPDYIMVMVANKKSQKQMTDDLSLFLGLNTEKFTSWLHSLLKKLQSINTDEPNAKPKTKEKNKGEKRKHRSSQGDREKKTDGERQRKSSTGEKEKLLDKKTVEDKTEPGTARVKPIQKTEETTIDELNIIENTDEFNEENSAAEVKEITQTSSTGKPPPTKVSKVDKSTDVKKSGTKSSVSSSKSKSSSSTSTKSRHDVGRDARKKPISIVASVKRRYEELDEDEEEYDPTNPAVGSVASVVRGPTRKSSIPQSLQANKSLLMKAVTEAEKSVTTKKKTDISPESSKPAMRSDRQPINLKHRLKTAAGLGLLSRSKRAEMNKKSTATTTTSLDTVKKPRKSDEGFENIKYTIKNEATSPLQKKVSPKAPASAPTRMATTALRDIGGGSKVKRETLEPESEEDQDEEEYGPPLPDTRLVQRTKPDTDSNPDSSRSASPDGQHAQDDDLPDPEIQQLLDEAHMTLDLNDDIIEDEHKYRIKGAKSTSPEPRFIVTLDGVDPDTYKSFSDVRQNPVQTVKPVPKPKPTIEEQPKPAVTPTADIADQIFAKLQPPKIKPFNISLKDTDDEEEGEEMDAEETEGSKSSTINERCRFWPACANGNECQFIHPSVPCKSFPYCKFGDKCLYIHPNCRFDAKCTRMDCPYTHSSRRKGLMAPTVIHKILQVPVQQFVPQMDTFKSSKPFQPGLTQSAQCKFFPNCRNMSCPFEHPKPCRYGIGCMNKSTCTFYHPPLPGVDKLKWTSKDKKSIDVAPTKTAATYAAK